MGFFRRFSLRLQLLISYGLLIAYCSLIFYLSSQTIAAPMPFANVDKLYHLAEYALLGVLAMLAFSTYGLHDRQQAALWVSWIFCALYGLSDEFHQSFVLGRDASLYDALFDALGGILGAGIFFTFLDKDAPEVVS